MLWITTTFILALDLRILQSKLYFYIRVSNKHIPNGHQMVDYPNMSTLMNMTGEERADRKSRGQIMFTRVLLYIYTCNEIND